MDCLEDKRNVEQSPHISSHEEEVDKVGCKQGLVEDNVAGSKGMRSNFHLNEDENCEDCY